MNPTNYRPITIPSNLLRLITVRLSRIMSSLVEENELLGPEQFGFRRGRSTTDATLVLTSLIQKAKAKKLPYSVAFIDISKVNDVHLSIKNAWLYILN